jgi:hypothetical protein
MVYLSFVIFISSPLLLLVVLRCLYVQYNDLHKRFDVLSAQCMRRIDSINVCSQEIIKGSEKIDENFNILTKKLLELEESKKRKYSHHPSTHFKSKFNTPKVTN